MDTMVDPIGTCQALDLLTTDQLEALFDDENGYLSRVSEVYDSVQNLTIDIEAKSHRESNSKYKRRSSKILTDKKCLILDVDNTLIYVRHFMDEMCVGDVVKLGDRIAIVTQVTYKLDLEFSETPGEITQYDHVIKSKDDHLPQRGDWFPDDKNKKALIHQADPIGCEVEIKSEDNSEGARNDRISISFLQNSDELSKLEPMMHRENFLPVTFMYGGYLVRIRPELGQFLTECNAHYDVILFTAADGTVYSGLLKQVHNILRRDLRRQKKKDALLVSAFIRQFTESVHLMVPHEIGREIFRWLVLPEVRKLWQQIYFRDDCDEKTDEYGLPYRHKNLAKLGRELSTIVMVDDNPLSYRGFEPNSVRVAGFWGVAEPPDNELMKSLFPILEKVHDHKDVRYYLSGLGAPQESVDQGDRVEANTPLTPITPHHLHQSQDVSEVIDRQREESRRTSLKFLQHLKDALAAEEEYASDGSFASDGSLDDLDLNQVEQGDSNQTPITPMIDTNNDTPTLDTNNGDRHLGVVSTCLGRNLSDVEEQSNESMSSMVLIPGLNEYASDIEGEGQEMEMEQRTNTNIDTSSGIAGESKRKNIQSFDMDGIAGQRIDSLQNSNLKLSLDVASESDDDDDDDDGDPDDAAKMNQCSCFSFRFLRS